MVKRFLEPDARRSSPFVDRSRKLRLLPGARQLVLGAVATLALAVLPSELYGSPPGGSHLVIVESKGAAGKMDRQRLTWVVEQGCLELHIGESAVPEIGLIHLAREEAHAGGVPAGMTVMVERSSLNVDWKGEAPPARFLVWVVGAPDDAKIVGAVAHVLRWHLELELSDGDLLLAEKRILQRLKATVDVSSFAKRHP